MRSYPLTCPAFTIDWLAVHMRLGTVDASADHANLKVRQLAARPVIPAHALHEELYIGRHIQRTEP